jgi:hypothetical protein
MIHHTNIGTLCEHTERNFFFHCSFLTLCVSVYIRYTVFPFRKNYFAASPVHRIGSIRTGENYKRTGEHGVNTCESSVRASQTVDHKHA